MSEQLMKYQPNTISIDVVSKLENLEEAELLNFIRNTLHEETKLWVARSLAVKELVDRKVYVTTNSYRKILKELADTLNASYTTLFYEYRIATTYHDLLVSHLTTGTDLPNKDILVLGLKLPNPEKFIENYHHDPSKTLQELKTDYSPTGTSEFPKHIIKIKLELTDSLAHKIQAILEIYGSLEAFLIEKIKEVQDIDTIDAETFDDLIHINEDGTKEVAQNMNEEFKYEIFAAEEEFEEEEFEEEEFEEEEFEEEYYDDEEYYEDDEYSEDEEYYDDEEYTDEDFVDEGDEEDSIQIEDDFLENFEDSK